MTLAPAPVPARQREGRVIEVATRDGEKLRAEAARVVIPGFEWLTEVYATPLLKRYPPEFDDERWVITDLKTGWAVSSGSFVTIEAAITATAKHLRTRKVTPEVYAKSQKDALVRNARLARRVSIERAGPMSVEPKDGAN